MRIGFKGRLEEGPEVRAGFIGCGSHSFRNIYPTFQFAPVDLRATCDLDMERARAFAAKFGARAAYGDYREMLEKEELDAVFVCTGYDRRGRPLYPDLAVACLEAGCHVWMEKPPAASCAEIERMQKAAAKSGKNAVVGLKKMFFPANEKAAELIGLEEFGEVQLALFQYPQYVPTAAEFAAYFGGERQMRVLSFLDHLCHPVSLMVFLLGMPRTVRYARSGNGAGLATFRFDSGALASLAFTHGAPVAGGMERTEIVSGTGCRVVVENNLRVFFHRLPALGYGDQPDYYAGTPGEVTAAWEPEFSLGQLYNKGLFLLGYFNEVNEFARAILEGRAPRKGTLEQAWQVTRIFEAFAEGEGREVEL